MIMYVGSTACGLQKLEENHRQAREKGYTMSLFRTRLEELEGGGSFRWLVKPAPRTQREVEQLEKDLINKHQPEFNVDYDPVASSESYGRYDNDEVRYRGVYCFEVTNAK